MMISLVYVDENLASSIALRYAGALANLTGMAIQPIHVEEPDHKSHSSGSGWVRRSWEQGLVAAGRQEVERLLRTEKVDCRLAGVPKVLVGDRQAEILDELQRFSYDLYIEGYLNTASVNDFYALLGSQLYRKMDRPALVVKNLVPLDRVLLLTNESVDCTRLIPCFTRLFQDAPVIVDLLYYKFREGGSVQLEDRSEAGSYLDNAEAVLAEAGRKADKVQVIQGSPEQVVDHLRSYGLVVSTFPSRKSPRYELLAMLPNPLLLCR